MTFDKREFFQTPSATSPMRCGILLLQVEKLRSSSVSGLKLLNILTTCRTSEDPWHDPSRHSQIRGIQKKRYNKKILKPVTGSVWFFHTGGTNPG
jgi:hypothetical protein